ncbi:macrophage mannose receptor 1-like [Sphaeramia orbicularis]|uniref:macrophage mannose receptor 1-like n=1 Tax=Sphaeramia orbicularis TaxID=375764 RepID=UPI00117C4F59|nr:macrophage mannose receptor 1-like [Sphaeramia orbicularis]
MGNRVVLVTWLLLTLWCCSEAQWLRTISYATNCSLSWAGVQRYCRRSFTDMVTWYGTSSLSLSQFLRDLNKTSVWVGLRRNAANDSQWNWINETQDVSMSINWDLDQNSPHCALLKADGWRWFSARCSSHHGFYCSHGTKIRFHSFSRSWFKAEEACQEEGGHLVTVTKNNAAALKKSGWIGLYRVGGDTWRWVGNQTSEYRTWANGEPSYKDCGSLNTVEDVYESRHCSEVQSVVCNKDNLVLVKLNRTWEEALAFCAHLDQPCTGVCRFHLLRVENWNMHRYVRQRIHDATTDEVWTGRRFLGGRWFWGISNLTDQPGGVSQCPAHHCGVTSKSNPNYWLSRDCTERRNFICAEVQEVP